LKDLQKNLELLEHIRDDPIKSAGVDVLSWNESPSLLTCSISPSVRYASKFKLVLLQKLTLIKPSLLKLMNNSKKQPHSLLQVFYMTSIPYNYQTLVYLISTPLLLSFLFSSKKKTENARNPPGVVF
jgi:hypothetical protein